MTRVSMCVVLIMNLLAQQPSDESTINIGKRIIINPGKQQNNG